MVTLFYLIIMLLMVMLISFVDMFYYNVSFMESLIQVISREPGTRKTIVAFANFTGFLTAIGIDYRVWKSKQPQKQIEGKES